MKTLQKLLLLLALPALSAFFPAWAAAADVPDLANVLGQEQEEFLHPDEAFTFRTRVNDGEGTVTAEWVIADGYYLYRQQFRFEVVDNAGIALGEARFPEGTVHTDEFFGEQEVYYQQVTIELPVIALDGGEPGVPFMLRVRYQGCADAGLCYPPIFKTVNVAVPGGDAGAGAANTNLSEQDQLAQLIRTGNIGWVILAFIGFGLLLTFTPCVLPMVPILSSIIVGQENLTTRKAFTLSLIYVLAMALTYTIAGVLAGLFGANLQAMFQNPYVLVTFAAVFVLLALSMFGFYDLQIPASWQAKLATISNSQKGGTLTGVAVMGFLSALIVGPCVAAPLAGALIVIGQSGDPVRGGLALFALSMGMGIPLILIGTGFGKAVPKAGGWMNAVKGVFGVMLLAVALYLLDRVLMSEIVVALWAVLAIVSAVYMGAFAVGASGWQKLWKGLGLAVFLWGVLLVIGLAGGRADLFTPLKHFTGGTAAIEEEHLPFQRIKSVADLEREVAKAASMNKAVMLDFYADWCISCKEMERYTFTDPAVRKALGDTVLLQADVTANDDADQALLAKFGLFGPPGIIFFNRSGEEQPHLRVIGYKPAEEFAAHVNRAVN
ncbi:MAG TPA: protein-disulfide reductase DsbD [Gammaproteobacteria bacterium]